jgi:hypothetical protein
MEHRAALKSEDNTKMEFKNHMSWWTGFNSQDYNFELCPASYFLPYKTITFRNRVVSVFR